MHERNRSGREGRTDAHANEWRCFLATSEGGPVSVRLNFLWRLAGELFPNRGDQRGGGFVDSAFQSVALMNDFTARIQDRDEVRVRK